MTGALKVWANKANPMAVADFKTDFTMKNPLFRSAIDQPI
jgi:hypothetical protein